MPVNCGCKGGGGAASNSSSPTSVADPGIFKKGAGGGGGESLVEHTVESPKLNVVQWMVMS